MRLWQFVLFLHILLAILAFGPTFAFELIGAAAEKEPQHANFALRMIEAIERRLVLPSAVVMPFLGLWLIFLRDWDLWGSEWLVISIVIYTIAFFVAAVFIRSWLLRMIELTKPGPNPAEGGGPPAGGWPPPEIAVLVKRSQIASIFVALAIIAVLILMVWKPGAAFLTG